MNALPGSAAEGVVASWLLQRGVMLLERRLRLGALEVDIVAREADLLLLIEVRGRRCDSLVPAVDSLGARKRSHLARAALLLWQRYRHDRSLRTVRIDLVTVTWQAGPPTIAEYRGVVDPAEAKPRRR